MAKQTVWRLKLHVQQTLGVAGQGSIASKFKFRGKYSASSRTKSSNEDWDRCPGPQSYTP